MYYVITVVDKQQAGELAGFIESTVRRHLEAWSNEFNVVTLELRWVAGRLILKTDSVVLIQLWNKIEHQYVAHMLGDQANIAAVSQFTAVAA